MMKSLITICIVCLALSSKSQVPGYLGKKFVIGYSANVNAAGTFNSEQNMRLRYKNNFIVGAAIGRTSEINMSIGLFTLSPHGDAYYDPEIAGKPYFTGRDNYTYYVDVEDAKYSAVSFDFNLRTYRKNTIAPIGLYLQYGFGITKYTKKENPFTAYTFDGSALSEEPNYNLINDNSSALRFSFGGGKRTILSGIIFIDFGLTATYVHDSSTDYSSLTGKAYQELRNSEIIFAHLGLGIIL